MIPVSSACTFFPLTTKRWGWKEGMEVRRASEAEQCGLADNIKEHNLGGASANLRARHATHPTIHTKQVHPSPLRLLPLPSPNQQCSLCKPAGTLRTVHHTDQASLPSPVSGWGPYDK